MTASTNRFEPPLQGMRLFKLVGENFKQNIEIRIHNFLFATLATKDNGVDLYVVMNEQDFVARNEARLKKRTIFLFIDMEEQDIQHLLYNLSPDKDSFNYAYQSLEQNYPEELDSKLEAAIEDALFLMGDAMVLRDVVMAKSSRNT